MQDGDIIRASAWSRYRYYRCAGIHIFYTTDEGGLVMRLEAEHVGFRYTEDKDVLKDVTFTYNSPDIMCILGHNGTGKSTLLQCITAQMMQQKGTVKIDGRPSDSYRPAELAKKIAYLPQYTNPAFNFTVLDVVVMGRTSRIGKFASPGEAEKRIAMEKLEYLGIAHLAGKTIKGISGGERQMVMIASALAQEPELLIMDEPTSNLDFGNQFKFVNLVRRLQGLGIGVLMTTHFPDHALYLNCPTAILDNGVITDFGPASEVITEERMTKLYGIVVKLEMIRGRMICLPESVN